jgi:modulator of FtsH protease HflK
MTMASPSSFSPFSSPVQTPIEAFEPLAMSEGGPENRRPGQRDGPPDLEELWRDLNRRIAGLFGKKGGGAPRETPPNGSGPSPATVRGGAAIFGIVATAVVLIWLASGFFIVQEGQTGVILQFGRFKATTGAGIQWRLPYPFQTNEIVNVSGVRTVEVGYSGSSRTKVPHEALMLTEDENIIDVQMAVQYRLKDAAEFLFNNANDRDAVRQSSADEIVKQAAETSIREVVGRSKMDTVLYQGREQISVEVQALMQQILERYRAGVTVLNVTLQNTQPPEQVQAAFNDAVTATQDRERLKNEGQAYANDVIPRAKGDASRLLQEADGYKQRVIANAQGDASRFSQVVTEYAKAPAVTRQRMYVDTMQDIYSNAAKIVVDSHAPGNLLMLPLDKILQQAAQDAPRTSSAPQPGIASSPGASVAPAPDDTSGRTRDSLRSRDRDSGR